MGKHLTFECQRAQGRADAGRADAGRANTGQDTDEQMPNE
jgi:hypothetical protein